MVPNRFFTVSFVFFSYNYYWLPWWWELTSINFRSLICQLVLFTFLFIQFYPNPSISSFSFPFSFLLRRRFSLSSCCDLFGIVSEVVEEWKAIIFFHFNPTLIDSNISPYRIVTSYQDMKTQWKKKEFLNYFPQKKVGLTISSA